MVVKQVVRDQVEAAYLMPLTEGLFLFGKQILITGGIFLIGDAWLGSSIFFRFPLFRFGFVYEESAESA